MNNYQYYNFSKDNPEEIFDSYYEKGKLIIPKSTHESNKLTENNQELIELITAFKVFTKLGKTIEDEDIKKIIDKIIFILDNTQGINYSAFCQYFMVHNFTYSLYEKIKNKKEKTIILYELLIKYCQQRHDIYLSHGYSNAILQVMKDNYSHKSNSKTGINKILEILSPYNLKHALNLATVKEKEDIYFLPDKGNSKLFEQFLIEFNLEMQSRKIEQNKLPDIIFKHNENYYICELKSMKEQGGGQDKQAIEMAHFINFSEKSSKIHYLTFLDCQYANEIFINNSPKIVAQRKDIEKALLKNPNNYFLNTKGFIKFTTDIFSI